MKILLVHNDYGKRSGEETAFEHLRDILSVKGHEVREMRRAGLGSALWSAGAAKALVAGIYNPNSRARLRRLLQEWRPDVIHVQNLFPFISPSILDEAFYQRIPVVMTLQNYRLFCPSGTFLSHGAVCTRCLEKWREWNCVRRNCEGNVFKSAGYATRNAVARLRHSFVGRVQHFIAVSEYQKAICHTNGIPAHHISVIPNMVPEHGRLKDAGDRPPGKYVGYVGRVSPEKGISVIVEAARRLPEIPFLFAGDHSRMPELVRSAPTNCSFVGQIVHGAPLRRFYDEARLMVFASIWYEASPFSCLEAMSRGRPLVGPRIGAVPEIIQDRVNGLLYDVGDANQLAEKIEHLWRRPDLTRDMGTKALELCRSRYSDEVCYEAIISVYDQVRRGGVSENEGTRERA